MSANADYLMLLSSLLSFSRLVNYYFFSNCVEGGRWVWATITVQKCLHRSVPETIGTLLFKHWDHIQVLFHNVPKIVFSCFNCSEILVLCCSLSYCSRK